MKFPKSVLMLTKMPLLIAVYYLTFGILKMPMIIWVSGYNHFIIHCLKNTIHIITRNQNISHWNCIYTKLNCLT